jgi:hypothetical protein
MDQPDYLRRLGMLFQKPYNRNGGNFDIEYYPFINMEAISYTLK